MILTNLLIGFLVFFAFMALFESLSTERQKGDDNIKGYLQRRMLAFVEFLILFWLSFFVVYVKYGR